MIGAIIGDIAGSRFKHINHKSKEFELLVKKCRLTDDSVMSLALAKAILDCNGHFGELSQKAISSMHELGRQYKNSGYAGGFYKWIWSDDPQPYNSFGIGSAMRVSPCGYAAASLAAAKALSARVTEVSHNHPEGMKGAEAVATAIFLARKGKSKDGIRNYILDNYYDINFTLDQIRETYFFDVTCQGVVPVALEAFFEATDFEDAVRNAISVGGDSDTIAAITGSVAEAYYGVPEVLINSAIKYLDSRQMEILYNFEKKYPSMAIGKDGKIGITVFDIIDKSVDGGSHTPDFSSFDKPDMIKEAKGKFIKASKELSKSATKAREGVFSATKSVKETLEQAKASAASKTVYCYAISTNNDEDTEITITAVSALKEAGYDARIYVSGGTMFGYVFAKGEDFHKAAGILDSIDGVTLNEKPVDKNLAELIKKHS
nr:ADP-ribosylglycohydrolase family protein [Oscillospiraceae bacterium]